MSSRDFQPHHQAADLDGSHERFQVLGVARRNTVPPLELSKIKWHFLAPFQAADLTETRFVFLKKYRFLAVTSTVPPFYLTRQSQSFPTWYESGRGSVFPRRDESERG